MKTKTNKIISLIVATALLLSLFSGVTLSGTVKTAFAEDDDVERYIFRIEDGTYNGLEYTVESVYVNDEYVYPNVDENFIELSLATGTSCMVYIKHVFEEDINSLLAFEHTYTDGDETVSSMCFMGEVSGDNDDIMRYSITTVAANSTLECVGRTDWKYIENDDAMYLHTSESDSSTKYSILEEIDGYSSASAQAYTLQISGVGKMSNVGNFTQPWYNENYQQITQLDIKEGLLSTGMHAFIGLENLGDVVIPASIIDLGPYSLKDTYMDSLTFAENSALTTISDGALWSVHIADGGLSLPETLTSIGYCGLYNSDIANSSGEQLVFPKSITEIGAQGLNSMAYSNTLNVDDEDYEVLSYVIKGEEITTLSTASFFISNLASAVFNQKVEVHQYNVFCRSNAHSIVFNNGLTFTDSTDIQSFDYIYADITVVYFPDDTYLEGGENYYNYSYTSTNAIMNGGIIDCDYEFTAGTLATPTKEGYIFGGWYDNSYFTSEAVTEATSKTTYYAKWTCETPVIEDIETTSYTYLQGDEVTALSVSTSVTDGGTLSCQWYSSSDNSDFEKIENATSATYTPSSTTADTTYYYCEVTNTKADGSDEYSESVLSDTVTVVIIPKYTVTFNTNGGDFASGDIATADTTIDYTLSALIDATPTRPGYTFAGWFDAATGGDEVTTSTGFEANTDVYAQWTANTYTLSYNIDSEAWEVTNVDGTDVPYSYTYATDKITLPVPTKTGYTFSGWFASNDFDNDKTVITTFDSSNITAETLSTITFYGYYTANEYEIAYTVYDSVATTGDVTNDNPTKYTIEDSITLVSPTLEGYVFVAWYDAASGGNVVRTISASTEAKTLYASWIKVDSDDTVITAIKALTQDTAKETLIEKVIGNATEDMLESAMQEAIALATETITTVTGESVGNITFTTDDASVTSLSYYEGTTASGTSAFAVFEESDDAEGYSATETTYIFAVPVSNEELESSVEITISFSGEEGKEYKIAHYKADGNVELLVATYDHEAGTLTFTTTSFSSFMVMEKEIEEVVSSSSSSRNITISSSYTVSGSSSSATDVEAETEVEEETPATTETPVATETPTATIAPVVPETQADSSNNAWIWIVLGVLVVGGVAGYVIYKKKKQ
ncbi:MAG: InlB B-repeat-containing protein [Bacillota bacterium]